MIVNEPLVKVKFYAGLRAKAGREEIECHASKVRDAVHCVRDRFGPDFGRALNSCHIYLNHDSIAFLHGPNTKLKEGDVLHILPPTGGG